MDTLIKKENLKKSCLLMQLGIEIKIVEKVKAHNKESKRPILLSV